jgi:molybdopterin molybdotransferase
MISFEEARKIVLENVKPLGKEKIFLTDALRRVLAEDIIAVHPLPPFSNSAMDGFALKSEDTKNKLPVRLKVIGEEQAGEIFDKEIQKGETIRILTGAPIPSGVDAVIPQEEVKFEGNFIIIEREVTKGENIRQAGEDVIKGEKVLEKGTSLSSSHIALLAALGKGEIDVYIAPKVGILATGEEIKEFGEPLKPGSIRNSNTYSLIAQIKSAGAIPLNFGKAGDNPEEIKNIIESNIESCDVLLTTGGVSVGKYDFVRKAYELVGAQKKFWKVAQKPGKPLAFYLLKRDKREKYLFGLPGNPASVMISFEEYVRPLLYLLSGRKNYLPKEIEARLSHEFRKKRGRINFLRVKLTIKNGEYWVEKAGPQGSGFIKTLINTHAIALIPSDVEYLSAGDKVKIHLVEW